MIDLEQIDIKLDSDGQPEIDATGDVALIGYYDCYYQDIKLEALTQEGDIFYDDDYGWSMLDFIQVEYDELVELEIQARIKQKLANRTGIINESSITVSVENEDDSISVSVAFQFVDSNDEYTIDLNIDGTEVTIADD